MSDSEGEPTKTICPYCGVGCGLQLEPGEEQGDVDLKPWFDAPVNEGALCIKGGASTEVVNHPDRLTEPLIKEDGEFREASWEEAYDLVESELGRIKEEYEPDAMGFFGCSKAVNEIGRAHV